MARRAFEPTEAQRHTVTLMSHYGIRQTDIATEIGVRSPKTLRKHFREELDHGRIGAEINVAKTLYGMATSGKHVSATIYWIARRGGLSRPTQDTGAAATPDFVVAREKEAA